MLNLSYFEVTPEEGTQTAHLCNSLIPVVQMYGRNSATLREK